MKINKIEKLLENNVRIPNDEKFCAIIGLTPSQGARSPLLWNKTYKKMQKNISMIPFDCKIKNFNKLLKVLEYQKNFIGGAIAAPFKEKTALWLGQSITKESKKIGAINCIFKKSNNKLIGTNTDGEGAIISIKKNFGSIRNKNIIIMGTGGTAKAIVAYLVPEIGPKGCLKIIGRNYKKLSFHKLYKKTEVYLWKDIKKISKEADIIINCTSIGWGNQSLKSPISLKFLNYVKKSSKFFDVIYDPRTTVLLKHVRKKGFKSLNGLDMNLQQAVLAYAKVNKMTNKLNLIKNFMNSKN